MSTLTSDRPAEVAAIADPLERLAAAQDLVRTYEARSNASRSNRDMAVIVAHFDHGISAVTLYRDTIEVSRSLFSKIIARAPASLPRLEDPVRDAREAAGAVRRNDELADRARTIRDDTALLLMNGGADPATGDQVAPVSNADIARATGLTTARVAQVRTGSR